MQRGAPQRVYLTIGQRAVLAGLCAVAMTVANVQMAAAILGVTTSPNRPPANSTTPSTTTAPGGPGQRPTSAAGSPGSSQPAPGAQAPASSHSGARSATRMVLPFAFLLLVGLIVAIVVAPHRRKRRADAELRADRRAESAERDPTSGRFRL